MLLSSPQYVRMKSQRPFSAKSCISQHVLTAQDTRLADTARLLGILVHRFESQPPLQGQLQIALQSKHRSCSQRTGVLILAHGNYRTYVAQSRRPVASDAHGFPTPVMPASSVAWKPLLTRVFHCVPFRFHSGSVRVPLVFPYAPFSR